MHSFGGVLLLKVKLMFSALLLGTVLSSASEQGVAAMHGGAVISHSFIVTKRRCSWKAVTKGKHVRKPPGW